VPKPIRWRFQLETSQVLRVDVSPVEARLCWESFYIRIYKSGRITMPKVAFRLLQNKMGKQDLMGEVIEVQLAPA
jgi:hypothetical protein